MGVKLTLATDGIMGVTGFTAAEITASAPIAENTVAAVTGTGDVVLTLPTPGPGQDFRGAVVIVKNLKTDGGNVQVLAPGEEVIDGDEQFMNMPAENDTASFYYIGGTVGWLAGPAG